MKKLLLALLTMTSITAFAKERKACEIDTFLRLHPAIFSTTVKAERSDLNLVECLIEASRLSDKNEKVDIRINDKDLNIKGKLQIRTNSVIPRTVEACRIDFYLNLKPAILSSWVKAEYSDLNSLECLVKAFDIAEKNDKVNVRINDEELKLKGKLEIRK
jgi:hypothetical protein